MHILILLSELSPSPSPSSPHPLTPTLLMYCSALDVLRVLVVTGSKVMLDLVLTEGTTQQLCQLLTWGDQGTIISPPPPPKSYCYSHIFPRAPFLPLSLPPSFPLHYHATESASSLELCVAILRLMECGLERAPCELSLVVLSALLSQWTCFTGEYTTTCMATFSIVYGLLSYPSLPPPPPSLPLSPLPYHPPSLPALPPSLPPSLPPLCYIYRSPMSQSPPSTIHTFHSIPTNPLPLPPPLPPCPQTPPTPEFRSHLF